MKEPDIHSDLLGKENYDRLARHIAQRFPNLSLHLDVPQDQLIANPFYQGIAPLLNLRNRLAHDTARQQLVGSYRIHRPSKRAINFVYVGHMDIAYDEPSDSFTVRERYAKTEAEQWDMPGTIYPISQDFLILVTANLENDTLHVKYGNEIRYNTRKAFTGFSGWMSHTYKRQFYCCRFHAEKIHPVPGAGAEAPLPVLEYRAFDSLPADIQHDLGRPLFDKDYACVYHE